MKVEKAIFISARPERVWQAWVGEISQWWKRPYFNDAERATGLLLEPRLGGRFVELWGEAGEGYLLGQVVEWLPIQSFAFTWTERSWLGIATMVRVELHPEPQGTQLILMHGGFDRLSDGTAQRSGYESGWSDLLDMLKTHLKDSSST